MVQLQLNNKQNSANANASNNNINGSLNGSRSDAMCTKNVHTGEQFRNSRVSKVLHTKHGEDNALFSISKTKIKINKSSSTNTSNSSALAEEKRVMVMHRQRDSKIEKNCTERHDKVHQIDNATKRKKFKDIAGRVEGGGSHVPESQIIVENGSKIEINRQVFPMPVSASLPSLISSVSKTGTSGLLAAKECPVELLQSTTAVHGVTSAVLSAPIPVALYEPVVLETIKKSMKNSSFRYWRWLLSNWAAHKTAGKLIQMRFYLA